MKKTILFITLFVLLGLTMTYAITQTQFLNLNLDNVKTKGAYNGLEINGDEVKFNYQYEMLDDNLQVYNKQGSYITSKKEIIDCINEKNLKECKLIYKEIVKARFFKDYYYDLDILKKRQEAMKNDLSSFDLEINNNDLEK